MKKLILSALAISLTAGAFAQELSKEEQKVLKENQKAITTALKAAEKAAKLAEDGMGGIDMSKVPNFAAARQEVAKAFANPAANTMLGDINRVAGQIEYNEYQITLPKAGQGDQDALNTLFNNCGQGFQYLQAAWNAYATPDAKGKTNTKFNETLANNAWSLYSVSNGLANCGFTAYNAQDWASAAKYFQLAADGAESPMLALACAKNPAAALEMEKYAVDSVKFQNVLYAGSCLSNIDKNKSIEVFKSLIGKNTPQLPVYSSIVGEYAQQNDTTQMINWLQKGMEALPTESYFSNNLFAIYIDRNDLDGAIGAMKASLNNNPNNAGLQTILGRLFAQKEEFDSAKPYFEKALSLDPNNLDANLYFAYTYLAEMEKGESEMLKNHASNNEMDKFTGEKIDTALPYLRKAYQLDTNHENNDVCNLLTQVLYRKYQPSTCPADQKKLLKAEYEEVKAAYGR